MTTRNRGRSYLLANKQRWMTSHRLLAFLALVLVVVPIPSALAQQDESFQAFEIRRTYGSDMGVSAPVGVAYRGATDSLVIVDGAGMAVEATRAGEPKGQPFAVAGDAITLAVDAAGDLTTIANGEIQTTSPGGGPRSTRPAPLAAAAGAAFDAGTGSLYFLEGNDLVVAETGERITLQGTGGGSNRGLAVDPATGLIYVGTPSGRVVQVFDRTGTRVRTLDLSSVEIADQQGMAIAPSADPTDDPSVQRLYLADASGSLVEVAIEAETVVAAAVTSTANVVRTYNTWQFSPPSPDPSGIVWLPYQNQVMISDGEVEEMNIFNNVNLWYATPTSGANSAAGNTASFNTEPTGLAIDPGTGPGTRRLFISSDNGSGKVDIVSLGANDRFDLTDTRSSFSTGFADIDTEDLAYHQGNGNLYITDGVGREVWSVDPGTNGVFQGGGDDIISSFDMNIHGAIDPDGIAYVPATGRLLVLDDPSLSVYEVDTDGTLVSDINISISGMTRMAAVTLAPASDNSGATRMYIVDRKIDNNSDPNENDGLMYEMTAPLTGGGGGNQRPVANAGADQQINSSVPASTTLNGNGSTDDTGITSYAWTKLSGPTATIDSPGSASTTVSLSATGTYTFRLTVTDEGGLTDTDDVVVTVVGAGGPFTWDGAVAAGSDDAEQFGDGTVRLANSELELVVKATDVQTVGLRFPNVAIPRGATIDSAYVQFRAASVSSGTANLTIKAQASDDAPTFSTGPFHISNRPTGTQSVTWNPGAWDLADEVGPDQRTADLTTLVQSVVSRTGWSSGNGLALIFTGSGTRVADAIEGGFAPQLHVVYSTDGPSNDPPNANAGADQQVSTAVPATVTLNGSGSTDDGGAGNLTYEWTKLTGPTASIANPNSATTSATLSQFGTYTFRLTVTDGAGLTDTDDVAVTVTDPNGPVTFQTTVAVGADDAEENPNGRMILGNNDLDMVLDSTTTMVVGLRFTGVQVPVGANITNAYIQFRSDEIQNGGTTLSIRGHDVANAPAFTTVKFNMTGRTRTTANVTWTPDPWTAIGLTGLAQRTSNVASIVSEITASGSGWSSGNAMVFIITGSGKRTADPFEGGFAPRLVIEYTTP